MSKEKIIKELEQYLDNQHVTIDDIIDEVNGNKVDNTLLIKQVISNYRSTVEEPRPELEKILRSVKK